MDKPKILYLDIELSRMIVEFPTYNLYNIDKISPKYIKHDQYITCAAWTWLDNETKKVGKIHGVKTSDYFSYDKDFRDDYGIVKELREQIEKADLVVGHNSDSFDLKKINYRAVYHKLEAQMPPASVDTLKAARKYLRSSSNSLFYLAKEFGVSMKQDLDSKVMWAADEGCETSLNKLFKYCKQDVKAGAELYYKLLPHIHNHPDLRRVTGQYKTAAQASKSLICPSCGSSKTKSHGLRTTKTGRYRRYQCNNCGTSFKGEKV